MTMIIIKRFRTLSGEQRKQAVRLHLTTHHGIAWDVAPQALTPEQCAAVAHMARAVCWRKAIGCPLNLGAAYFVYLQRG